MGDHFIKNKITSSLAYLGGIIVHGGIPISIDYLFHKFKYTIYFSILIILSILIYLLLKKHFTRVKIKDWKIVAKYSLISAITIIIILLFFSLKFVTTTKNEFTYIKGTEYTAKAQISKLNNLNNVVSDNDLVDSYSGNVNMVFTDFEFFESIFSILLISFIIAIDTWACSYLQSIKYKKRIEK